MLGYLANILKNEKAKKMLVHWMPTLSGGREPKARFTVTNVWFEVRTGKEVKSSWPCPRYLLCGRLEAASSTCINLVQPHTTQRERLLPVISS